MVPPLGAANKPTLAYQHAHGELGVHERRWSMDAFTRICVLLALIALVLLAAAK